MEAVSAGAHDNATSKVCEIRGERRRRLRRMRRSSTLGFALLASAHGFVAVAPTPNVACSRASRGRARPLLAQQESGGETPDGEAESSLSDKMASWDATDDERRATTLGGNLPGMVPGLGPPGRDTRTDQPDKMDGFDIGLNSSMLFLLPLLLIFASVPFWIGSIDVSSVGPPPTS